MQKRYRDWPLWEKIFFPCFLALMTAMTILTKGSYLALSASILCFCGAYFNTKIRWDAYAFNAVGAVLYGIIALTSRNYSEMALAFLYNTPSYVWALLKWRKNGEPKGGEMEFFHMEKKKLWLTGALCVAAAAVYSVVLWKIGSESPVFNAIATCSCVVAILMASRRYMEQWLFWTFYNLALVIIWMPTGAASLANISLELTSIGYLVLSTNGWIQWHKMEKAHQKTA